MTRGESLYQVKLILDCLPEDEYKLIPQDMIDYIENNFEYNDSIIIDPNIPLDEQNLDYRTYDMLERIIKKTDKAKKEGSSEYVQKVDKSNEEYDLRTENIELKNIIESLEKEIQKVPDAKRLCQEYQNIIKEKEDRIVELELINEKTKNENDGLRETILGLPAFVKKIFMKNKGKKLLDK